MLTSFFKIALYFFQKILYNFEIIFNLSTIKHMIKKQNKIHRCCDFKDCNEPGEYRAPKDRNLNDYYWFCLKHVTEYNKNWNFYQGLSSEEIEQHIQNDTTWQRPTWKLGQFKNYTASDPSIDDKLHILNDIGLGMDGKHNPPQHQIKLHGKLQAAIDFLQVSYPLKLDEIKKQYKKLAKKFHPDTNHGDKDAEKMFKKLHEHYKYILKHLGEK